MKSRLTPDEVFEACRKLLRERGLRSDSAAAQMHATPDGPPRGGVQMLTLTFDGIEYDDVERCPVLVDRESAYWEGNDAGVAGVCAALTKVLDGPLDNKPCFGGSAVQRLAERLLALRQAAESAHKANVELERAVVAEAALCGGRCAKQGCEDRCDQPAGHTGFCSCRTRPPADS